MVLSRLTKITSPGIKTDTNWIGNNALFTGVTTFTNFTSSEIDADVINTKSIVGTGLSVVGVVTATSFVGSGANLTGIDATSIKHTDGNVKVQATGTGANLTGNLSVSGNVSIGGTLTYEDVTNIDSVGIITAQKDIHVGAGLSVVGISTLGKINAGAWYANSGYSGIWHTGMSGQEYIIINGDGSGAKGDTFISAKSGGGVRIRPSGNSSFGEVYVTNSLITANADFVPASSNSYNLGRTANKWLQIHANGLNLHNTGIATMVGADINGDIDVDGHTNLDNVSIAGVTTFSEDVKFTGATSGRDIIFDKSDNQLEFASNAKAYFGGSYPLTIYNNINSYISQNPNAALFIESKDTQIYGSGNGYNAPIFIARNGIVELGYEPSGGSLSTQLKTSAKGITVGTGVTIETNGQATFTGIVTASTYYGDGSNLSNITSTTINNNADNRIITGSGSANTLNGESNLTYDGNNINLAINNSGEGLRITATGNHYSLLKFNSNVSSAGGSLCNIQGHWNGTEVANIIFAAGDDTSNKDDGYIKFLTTPSGGSSSERLRITSGGQVNIGTDLTNSTYLFSSRGTGHNRVEILSTDNNSAGIYLRTFNSGSQVSSATVRTDNSGNLQFYTAASGSEGERLRIDSVGDVFIARTGGLSDAKLSIQCDTGEAAIAAQMNTSSSTASNLLMAYNSGGVNIANISCVTTATPDLTFNLWNGSSTAQKMRLTSGGAVEIGTGTGSGGGGLAIYGGTVNNVSGNDAALYVRHDSNADWGMWLYKQHEYGFRIDSNSSATLSLAIYDQSNNLKHQFKGNGDYVASGAIDSTSDIKLKTNIKTIDNALDKVLQLRGAEYDRIDKDNQHEIGVIAQEVEEVIPELVHGDETKTVSYGNMTAVLIEAIKEQNEVINKMKKEIEDLKG